MEKEIRFISLSTGLCVLSNDRFTAKNQVNIFISVVLHLIIRGLLSELAPKTVTNYHAYTNSF